MNSLDKSLLARVGKHGLTQLTVDEFFNPNLLLELVADKVNRLNPDSITERELEKMSRLFADVVRSALSRHYKDLSLVAFAKILLALDHFLRVNDEIPDTRLGGYKDDLAKYTEVVLEFRAEFDKFNAWKSHSERHL